MFVFVGGFIVLCYGALIWAFFTVEAELQETLEEDYFLDHYSGGQEDQS